MCAPWLELIGSAHAGGAAGGLARAERGDRRAIGQGARRERGPEEGARALPMRCAWIRMPPLRGFPWWLVVCPVSTAPGCSGVLQVGPRRRIEVMSGDPTPEVRPAPSRVCLVPASNTAFMSLT